MWTFNQLWGVNQVDEVKKIIEEQKFNGKITNLEEQALSMVGTDIYQILIKGYTEKQWNRNCSELPPSIIKRIPVRFDWNVSYFNDRYVGIPVGGYTHLFEKMLDGVEIKLNTDFFEDRKYFESCSDKIIYTGPIDKFYNYEHGVLEYRSLKWETVRYDKETFQGNSVVNYTDKEIPFTRILEHKWFENNGQKGTIISYEFPCDYNGKNEPYYPIRDDNNMGIYSKYQSLNQNQKKVFLEGDLQITSITTCIK